MPESLRTQLDRLQRELHAQQVENHLLQTALDNKNTQAKHLLEQRTRQLQQEAKEQKKAETLQRVFYTIAERSTAGLTFYDFLKAVHGLLEELLYAKNFYVCLCKPDGVHIDFPYYVDEKDGEIMQCNNVKRCNGMTEFVLRSNSPQLIDADRLRALREDGQITEATGDLTFSTWLGVPMQMHGAVGGMLALQAYEAHAPHYTEADAHILCFVANHVSAAIERYQALEVVRKSEARYRSLIENVGVGVVVVQDLQMVFINPIMVHIVGHPVEFLLGRSFTSTIHPEDVQIVSDRHHSRLRGESMEDKYSFRIITAAGEVRTLELTAAIIQWSNRDATLLFVVDATARMETEHNKSLALQQQTTLNDMKARFITMASHEFRTPLATIQGSVELLQHYEDRMTADKKASVLQRIDDAVKRMAQMLDNVLVIGHTASRGLEFRPRALCIAALCRSLVDEIRRSTARQAAHIHLVLDLPHVDQLYFMDDSLIRHIVGNLLSNAIKYSIDGGEVQMSVSAEDDGLVFTVSDQGIGIPEADQKQLFASFHRASNVGSISGTGLGLSIVKEAVVCHKGRITVDSHLGQGSRFTVRLPAPQCSAQDETP